MKDIPDCYTISLTKFNEFSGSSQILKNGEKWLEINVDRSFINEKEGLVSVDEIFAEKSKPEINYRIKFDRFTGKEINL